MYGQIGELREELSAVATTKSQSEISKEMEALLVSIEGLHKSINILEDRVHPALLPATPQAEDSRLKDVPLMSPLATVISERRQAIEMATRHVADISRRLAL